jgi:serine protease AprX
MASPKNTGKGKSTKRRPVSETEANQDEAKKPPFTPRTLDRTVIALPLLKQLNEERQKLAKDPSRTREVFPVIIDINLEYPGGRVGAREWVRSAVDRIIGEMGSSENNDRQGVNETKSDFSEQYIFAELEGDVIRELVKQDNDPKDAKKSTKNGPRAIFHVWPDFKINSLINRSISTVKADAAQTSFSAYGEGIVWAVLDSGVQETHPHFAQYENLKLRKPLEHKDFTKLGSKSAKEDGKAALQDGFGHGTHVAGIIAGGMEISVEDQAKGKKIRAYTRQRDENDEVTYNELDFTSISGMAPKCKLLSLKVLDDDGQGLSSNLIAAIAMIQQINGYGRRLLIHGVNLSVGYDFDPEWFACGQSPLCVEVDRLVRSGVVVVVAAGNTGYGSMQSQFRGVISAGMDLTINDPGNAELAITVGSTHKDMPHVYGVSYFSSKGPTGDGRAKPDLVAPGEKIISCAAGKQREEMKEKAGDCDYLEESGTSMAAPHVSGVIAAFLSIRREFIGQPDKVKQIFLSTATDLNRERYFQGHGLVDLMRAIQSV